MTFPNGENPCESSPLLSLKLMKICVVRVLGPAVAKVTKTPRVGRLDRIIVNVGVLPFRGDLGIAVDAELNHEARNDPKEFAIVVKARTHKLIEPIGPVGRPFPFDLNHEGPTGRLEFRFEGVGSLLGFGARRLPAD